MKDTIARAIEASKQLCDALEAGEIQAASSLVEIRDKLIRSVPIPDGTQETEKHIDVDFEGLLLQLQELDTKIQQLAQGMISQAETPEHAKANAALNQQKINRRYQG